MDFNRVVEIVKGADRIIFDEKALHQTITKGYMDYATGVDVGVQKYVTEELHKLYPDIQMKGEEGKKETLDYKKPMWILDPIDGTNNLIAHMNLSAVSLAYCVDGEILAGVIYNPFNKELFTAEKGKGAYLNGERIHVSDAPDISRCMVSFGTNPYERDKAAETFDSVRKIFLKCIDVRRLGTASIDMAYVACGKSGAFYEQNLKPWDYAAGVIVVQEAGGTVTDMKGEKILFDRPCSVLADNGKVHAEMLELLK
jgi:myo-inositol-1(or 4)-monophosphatase